MTKNFARGSFSRFMIKVGDFLPVLVLFLAAGIVLVDQLLKIMAVRFLAPAGTVTAIPGLLDFVYVENTGAAFGLFANQRWVFIGLTAVFIVILIAVLFRYHTSSRLYAAGMVLILGGAVGNLIDRIVSGYVVDYLRLSFFPPVCNLADYCVVIGVVLMLVYLLFFTDFFEGGKKRKKVKEEAKASHE